LIQQGKNKQAIRDLTHSIKLNPNNGLSYFLRSEAYRNESNEELAENDLTRMNELDFVPPEGGYSGYLNLEV